MISEKGTPVETKIIDLIFDSTPIMVLGMFASFAALLTSKKHLSIRVGIGVFATASLTVLACDMIALEQGLSINLRIFTGVVGGFCARDIVKLFQDKYKQFVERKLP